MGQRKVITICMDSYWLTLYIGSVVYMLASRGPILKLYQLLKFMISGVFAILIYEPTAIKARKVNVLILQPVLQARINITTIK